MTTYHYDLHISGLVEGHGRMKAATLTRVLDGLLLTAERTMRLLATGSGGARGAKPRWLAAAIDVTVTGLKPGSTIVEMEAPRLGETAFGQTDAPAARELRDDTALDLAARAINEAREAKPIGDYFDGAVLEAILSFGKAAGSDGLRYEMSPREPAHGRFSLDQNTCAGIRTRLDEIKAPRPFIVSGRLDEIEHGNGAFRLLVKPNAKLPGRLDSKSLSPEALRPLWGKLTTVEGLVHFKANGQPRLIEARRISGRLDGDHVFEELPSTGSRTPGGSFDPIDLGGAWPGDEPLEELLAQLD